MTEGCLPGQAVRPWRSPVVVVIVILLIAMTYSLALLRLHLPTDAAIAVLTTVTAVTLRLARPLCAGSANRLPAAGR